MLKPWLLLAAGWLLLGAPTTAAPPQAAGARLVPAGQTVRGPLVVTGRDVLIRGRVLGDVTVTGGNVSVDRNGEVTGNIRVVRGDVSLASGAKVRGTVRFSAGTPSRPPAPARPAPESGATLVSPAPAASGGKSAPAGHVPDWLRTTSRFGLAAGVLACLVLLQVLFPFRFRRALETTTDRPAQIALVGALAALSVAALAAALFMLTQSLLGTVLALLLLGPPALVGLATAAPALGRRILPQRWQDGAGAAAALTGGLLWEAALLVPVLGWLLAVVIVIWGLGAFVCSFRAPEPLPGGVLFNSEQPPARRS